MDFVRTADADREADGEEGSEEEAGPVVVKTARDFFADFDDEAKKRPRGLPKSGSRGWKFDDQGADEEYNESTGLQEKIRARLLEKAGDEEDGDGAAGSKVKSKKGAKAKKKKVSSSADPVEPEETSQPEQKKVKATAEESTGTPEHLRTGIHFADLRLSRPLLRAVAELKFDSPTPIQRDVIPPALKGLDILATAETGSGKTASFLLPCLERLCQSVSVRSRRRDAAGRLIVGQVATKAVILIPTRELAVQCHSMLQNLAKYTYVTSQLVAGGFSGADQANSLRNQPDIVVATPGRLLDHLLNSQSVHMELLDIVIFDEADRLLEMGFKGECLE
ncbi:unnamed protein product, partial [Polarella glacialis]